MGTTLTYNGITLHNVVTREWDQEVRYDESGTDAMFHVFRMRFEGLLHSGGYSVNTTAVAFGGSDAPNMLAQYNEVHKRLLRTRGQLVIYAYDFGGSEQIIFQCDPAPGDMTSAGSNTPVNWASGNRDVDNGPKPKAFRILQVVGGKSLRVAFEIECCKLVCSTTYSGSGSAVGAMPVALSNRWSIEEGMDENCFTTRTIAGRMRLSTAVSAASVLPKYLVVPGLESGFRRSAVTFTVDKTGLECDYRIVDRQVHTAAPWPATKMNVRHTQSTNDGLSMTSEVYVELEGHPGADKKALFARAMQIMDAKLNFAAIESEFKTKYIPEHIAFTDHIGDVNRIEAVARFLETPAEDGIEKTFANLRKELGKPLALPVNDYGPYDPGISTPPAIYGYYPPFGESTAGSERRPSVQMLLQCYLQQPCVDKHGIAKGATYIQEQDEDDEPEKHYTPTEVIEEPPGSLDYVPKEDQWDESAKSSVYTYIRASSRYVTDELRVQLPVAASSASSRHSCVFKLGQSQCRRVIDYDAERAGTWPEVVQPQDEFTDEQLHGTLLRHWTENFPPSITVDGVTRLHRIATHLEYAMDRPPTTTEKYRIGVSPQTKYTQDADEVKFDPDIVYRRQDLNP